MLGFLGTALLASHAAAHGGVYRGPGGTVPPGGSPTGPMTPGPGPAPVTGGGSSDSLGWSLWWSFQRATYLELRAALTRGAPTTGSNGFYLGRGQTETPTTRLPLSLLQERVVPALLAALEERNQDVQTAALVALARIGVEPAAPTGAGTARTLIDVFRGHLASDRQEVAETAALALGILGSDNGAAPLADLLGDRPAGRAAIAERAVPERTRAFAAYGLALIGSNTQREEVRRFVVSSLAAALEQRDALGRDGEVACVLGLGLVPLHLADATVSAEAAERLPASASRQSEIRFLLGVLHDAKLPAIVRAHLPVALARLGLAPAGDSRALLDQKALVTGELLAALDASRSPEREFQQGCAVAFGLLGDSDADALDTRIRTELQRLGEQGEPLVRYLAWISMARCAARAGEGPTPRLGLPQARVFLLTNLARGTSISRPWAAIALGVLQRALLDGGSTPQLDVSASLRAAFEVAVSPDERAGIATAIGLSSDATASPGLLKLLASSRDDFVRGCAAVSLGWVGARDAIEPLREVVRRAGTRAELLRNGAIGLALLHDREVVPELVQSLRTQTSLATQSALASALGFIGDQRAVEPLLAILEDDQVPALAHAFAAVAIGWLCDDDLLPWNARIAQDVIYGAATPTLTDPASGTGVLDIL